MNNKSKIIILYYEEKLNIVEIANKLNISKQYVSKIVRKDYRHPLEKKCRKEQTAIKDNIIQFPEGYSINKYGEIIRPAREEKQEQVQESVDVQPNESKLTLKQKLAQFLQKNNLFMNLSFVDKFVHKQLDILPVPKETTRQTNISSSRTRENFINQLTSFGAYRNLPPIQRMSDPERIAQMQRRMQQSQQSKDGNERG